MSVQRGDAQALAPAPVEVRFSGERLAIRPLRLGEALEIIGRAEPVIEAFLTVPGGVSAEDLGFFTRLVARHRNEVPQVLAIATGRDPDFIASGDLAEALELLMTVYRVNRDFFDQHLAPAVKRWRGSLDRSGDGQTQ